MKSALALLVVLAVGCSGSGHSAAKPGAPPLATSFKGKRLDKPKDKGDVPVQMVGDARLVLDKKAETFMLTHEGHVLTGKYEFDQGKGILALQVQEVDSFPVADLTTVDLAANKAAKKYPSTEDDLAEIRDLAIATDWTFTDKSGVLTSASPEGSSPRYQFSPD